MPVKLRIAYPDGIYFVTFTCYEWLSLFELVNGYDLVYDWFDVLKKRGHYILGYVIMPNHLHSLIAFQNTGKSINTIIGTGKRFMAYDIVERLQNTKQHSIPARLQAAVHNSDRKRGKLHEVWQDSFDWKECDTIKLIEQKLDYMHNNPCRGKWQLVESPVDYVHSSAKFYITGDQGIYPVTNYMEIEDIDLTERKTGR